MRLDKRRAKLLRLALALTLLSASCSSPPSYRAGTAQFGQTFSPGSGEANAPPLRTRAELEDSILRFEGTFNAMMQDALRPLRPMTHASARDIQTQARRLRLNYSAAALDIALGTVPEQNLLDMVVFVELARDVFRDYWIPTVFKDEGKPVLAALNRASWDIGKVALNYLTPAQLSELKDLASAWHEQNPNIVTVEAVRMADFSVKAGAREKQIANEISGLFAPVFGMTAAADRALLLGERGFYYAQRAPVLIRMQAAAGFHDVLQEFEGSTDALQLRLMMEQTQDLLRETRAITRNLEPISAQLRTLADFVDRHPDWFNSVRIEVRSLLLGLLVVGSLLIILTGMTYVLAKLTYERYSKRRPAATLSKDERRAA